LRTTCVLVLCVLLCYLSPLISIDERTRRFSFIMQREENCRGWRNVVPAVVLSLTRPRASLSRTTASTAPTDPTAPNVVASPGGHFLDFHPTIMFDSAPGGIHPEATRVSPTPPVQGRMCNRSPSPPLPTRAFQMAQGVFIHDPVPSTNSKCSHNNKQGTQKKYQLPNSKFPLFSNVKRNELWKSMMCQFSHCELNSKFCVE
jgi:hypothetical protein